MVFFLNFKLCLYIILARIWNQETVELSERKDDILARRRMKRRSFSSFSKRRASLAWSQLQRLKSSAMRSSSPILNREMPSRHLEGARTRARRREVVCWGSWWSRPNWQKALGKFLQWQRLRRLLLGRSRNDEDSKSQRRQRRGPFQNMRSSRRRPPSFLSGCHGRPREKISPGDDNRLLICFVLSAIRHLLSDILPAFTFFAPVGKLVFMFWRKKRCLLFSTLFFSLQSSSCFTFIYAHKCSPETPSITLNKAQRHEHVLIRPSTHFTKVRDSAECFGRRGSIASISDSRSCSIGKAGKRRSHLYSKRCSRASSENERESDTNGNAHQKSTRYEPLLSRMPWKTSAQKAAEEAERVETMRRRVEEEKEQKNRSGKISAFVYLSCLACIKLVM